MLLSELLKEIGRECPFGDAEILRVTDRAESAGPGSLFVAVEGRRFDGHSLAGRALANGAAAWGVTALVFHTRKPAHRLLEILQMQGSWHDLALLGIPSIAMAQNAREERHGFVSNENGFTYIGLDPADEIIESNLKMYIGLSKESRQHFQDKLLSHDLRGGRRRVMGLIENL